MENVYFNKLTEYGDPNSEDSFFSTECISFADNKRHRHSIYMISYLLNGSISHVVNEQPFDLVAGDIVFFRPKDTHYYLRSETSTKSPATHRDMFFRLDFFEEICNFLDDGFLASYEEDPMPLKLHLPLERLADFEKKVKTYFNLPTIQEKKLHAKFFLIELLSLRRQNALSETVQNEKFPDWLNSLLQRMNIVKYFKEGLPELISYYNLDRSYMCRTFKKYMNMTMTDYLNEMRLKYASNQLLLTSNSILNIAFESGFSSVAYFSRLFKKRFGCSPSEYRKKANSNESLSKE